MKSDVNFWIESSHGYYENGAPMMFGVQETTVDLANYPYDIMGKQKGEITMNGLITATILAYVRGTVHSYKMMQNADGSQTVWAEFCPEEAADGAKTIYLLKILLQEETGIKRTFTRISGAEAGVLNRETGEFEPLWTDESLDAEQLVPYMAFMPVVIGAALIDGEVNKRIERLRNLPAKNYDENQNLYWLTYHFMSVRSEYYKTVGSVIPLTEESSAEFKNEVLDLLRSWEIYSFYHSKDSQPLGKIPYEKIAVAFSDESVMRSPLAVFIPSISLDDYYIDPKVKSIVDLMVMEKDSKLPVNTGMLYGPPASGKSIAVMLMAKMLNLPYIPVTFNSNISMDDLLGSWQPSEDGGIHFVESTFVEAYQSPSVVEFVECYYVKPGACGDLNTALDDTAQITLPNGKVIHRHPSCIIIATINAGVNEQDYRAVREQDASFDRRFEGFKEYLEPFDHNVFAQMIKHRSGYDNEDEIMLMIKVMNDMNRNADETGDWQTVYPSTVIRWAQHRKYKDIYQAAEATILPAASKNLDVQHEIRENILSNYW